MKLFAFAFAAVLFAAPAIAQEGGSPPPAAPPPPDSTEVPATAPAPIPAAAPAAPAVAAADDSSLALPMLVALRTRHELDAEQQRMTDLKAAALEKVTTQRTSEARREAQVTAKKAEIATLKQSIDRAKKEKRDADRNELETQKKKLEAQQRYLERLTEWHAAEAAFRKAEADYAQGRIDECRAEAKMLEVGDLSVAEVRQRIPTRNETARTIAALKARADKGAALAQAERTASERRKAVLDAYGALMP